MIVIEFGGVAEGVYVVVHTPDDKTQFTGPNVPPAPPSAQDIVPVGVVGELEVSATVEVNVTEPPGGTVAGFGVTETVGVLSVAVVRLAVPELV